MTAKFEIDGEEYDEFNEEDPFLMEAIAEDLQFNFIEGAFSVGNFTTYSEVAHNLSDSQMQDFIDLIDDNIGDLYVKYRGNGWMDDKEEEMTEPGLVIVWFKDKDNDDELVGYLSFKLCVDDDDVFVLYLFEIHLAEQYQGKKYGQHIINQFHDFAKLLRNSDNNVYKTVKGTGLTVFSDNERAIKWYTNLGYKLTEGSPVDKKLRGGKVIKPEYYLMRRSIECE